MLPRSYLSAKWQNLLTSLQDSYVHNTQNSMDFSRVRDVLTWSPINTMRPTHYHLSDLLSPMCLTSLFFSVTPANSGLVQLSTNCRHITVWFFFLSIRPGLYLCIFSLIADVPRGVHTATCLTYAARTRLTMRFAKGRTLWTSQISRSCKKS